MDPEMGGACRFCVLLDINNKGIFDRVQQSYGKGCAFCAWVGKWAKAFREGRTSLADNPRPGRCLIPDGAERIRAKVECEPYQSDTVMA
jgi:hypothetical protein